MSDKGEVRVENGLLWMKNEEPIAEHECEYPETDQGNWTVISRCRICDQLPPFEYIQAKMEKK